MRRCDLGHVGRKGRRLASLQSGAGAVMITGVGRTPTGAQSVELVQQPRGNVPRSQSRRRSADVLTIIRPDARLTIPLAKKAKTAKATGPCFSLRKDKANIRGIVGPRRNASKTRCPS